MNRCRRIVDQFLYRTCVDRSLSGMAQTGPQILYRTCVDRSLSGVAQTGPQTQVQQMIARGDGQGNINTDRLIVFNMGLGRDSMAMLALLAEDGLKAEGFIVRPQDLDAIVFSDPGMEWDHTYKALSDVDRMIALIEKRSGVRVPFFVLSKPSMQATKDYLSDMKQVWSTGARRVSHEPYRAWRKGMEGKSIEEKAAAGYYHLLSPIDLDYSSGRPNPFTVKIGDTSCTDRHKVQPIRKFMTDLGKRKFGPSYSHKGKGGWNNKVRRGEKVPHLNLLGIAKGEGGSGGPRELHMHPFTKENAEQIEHLKSLIKKAERGGRSHQKLDKKLNSISKYHRADEGGKKKVDLFVYEAYPLIEAGISKEGEAPILKRYGLDHIRKSGCVMCHSQPVEWYWVLHEKARRGDQWAARSLQRVINYQKSSFDYTDSKGNRGGVVVKSKMFQRQDPDNPKSATLGLNERRLIPEVIPLIYKKKVEPRIKEYMNEGMTNREATDQVMADIIAKDYAQGCTIFADLKFGSANVITDQGYHRTAISRDQPSIPLRHLQEHHPQLLQGRVLDFGSGRGSDCQAIKAQCYDPHHPKQSVRKSPTGTFDTVMMTYVVNVLPKDERAEAVKGAARMVRKGGSIVISARSKSDSGYQSSKAWTKHGDGYAKFTNQGVLQRFQRFYDGGGLRSEMDDMVGSGFQRIQIRPIGGHTEVVAYRRIR